MKVAAVDIGSNSIKLLVADAESSEKISILLRDKENVRLGQETLQTEILSSAAISSAEQALQKFSKVIETNKVEKIFTVATASVRAARNASQFIDDIFKRTGFRVEVLSALEEARLIGIAAARGCAGSAGNLLNIDIGGGSTEFSFVSSGEPTNLFSARLGAVGLTNAHLRNDPPSKSDLRSLRKEISSALERPTREFRGLKWNKATGTSGTILSLGATLNAEAKGTGRISKRTRDVIQLSALGKFNEKITSMTVAERTALPEISARRADILIAGGAILEDCMRAFKIDSLQTCDFSLREGVIIDRLRELEDEARPPLPDDVDPRLRSVQALARRFGCEMQHALTVARLAEIIFDSIAGESGLKRRHRLLLSTAALLHDVGYHIAHEIHHKHGFYLVKHSELTGFAESDKNVIANAVRYHRGGLPKDKHEEFMSLSPREKELVWKIGSIVRLADALDRSYESRVKELRCEVKGKTFRLEVVSDVDCMRECESAVEKGDMFEIAFERKLEIFTEFPLADEKKRDAAN